MLVCDIGGDEALGDEEGDDLCVFGGDGGEEGGDDAGLEGVEVIFGVGVGGFLGERGGGGRRVVVWG